MADALARAIGQPDLTLTKAKPDGYAKKLMTQFWPRTICGATMNTEYADEIQRKLQKINIRKISPAGVRSHTIGGGVTYDKVTNEYVELLIDKATYIAIEEDELDKVQTDVDLGAGIFAETAKSMALEIDRTALAYVITQADALNQGATAGVSKAYNFGTTASPLEIDASNAIKFFNHIQGCMMEQTYDPEGISAVIPQWLHQLLNESDLKNASITGLAKSAVLEKNGYAGPLCGVERYVSPVIPSTSTYWAVPFFHKAGPAFGAQATKEYAIHDKDQPTVVFRSRFMLWGCSVIRPECVGVAYIKPKAAT